MAHDFAKQRSSKNSGKRRNSKQQAISKENSVSGHWSWFFSGLFAGLLFGFIIYLGIAKPAALQNIQSRTVDPELAVEPAQEESTGVELGFYDFLVENEVTVEVVPVTIPSQSQAKPQAQTGTSETDLANYLLHAGSFQVRLNAEGLLAKLTLLNMDAAIVSDITWHRVRIGPFKGRNKAEEARNFLLSNNIDTKILLMR